MILGADYLKRYLPLVFKNFDISKVERYLNIVGMIYLLKEAAVVFIN